MIHTYDSLCDCGIKVVQYVYWHYHVCADTNNKSKAQARGGYCQISEAYWITVIAENHGLSVENSKEFFTQH